MVLTDKIRKGVTAMDRRDFIKGMSLSLLAAAAVPARVFIQ